MKTYHDIQGDGGSGVVAQVEARDLAIREALAGVRHRVAVGSGKGGVGKSTVTMALARALRRSGRRVAVLDGDFNGPCQAQLLGVRATPWLPGERGLALPRSDDEIGVVSFGSVVPEARPLELESVASGEEQVWRATRELATLRQLLAGVEWGELDVLLFDLPPGAERSVQFAGALGEETSFVLVTIPSDLSRSVVARSLAALGKTGNRVLGYVENMAGYHCRECGTVRPLFPRAVTELDLPCLGEIPFDPELAARCDRGEDPFTDVSIRAIDGVVHNLVQALESQP